MNRMDSRVRHRMKIASKLLLVSCKPGEFANPVTCQYAYKMFPDQEITSCVLRERSTKICPIYKEQIKVAERPRSASAFNSMADLMEFVKGAIDGWKDVQRS